jgi:hypothetical protein
MKEANDFEQLKIMLLEQHEAIFKLEQEINIARQSYMQMEAKFCEKNSYKYYSEVLPKVRAMRKKIEDSCMLPEDEY